MLDKGESMDAHKELLSPSSLQELFKMWADTPSAIPFAGGTQIMRYQGKRVPELPPYILSLDKIAELRRVTRTEQYLEIGAMVKLSDIINLGKIVPDVFIRCLENIAGHQIRSLATIGGNICNNPYRLDTSAPLIALEAHYELRTSSVTRWISAGRFSGQPGPLPLNPQELLTRIRIPLDLWDYSLYKKIKPTHRGKRGGSIVFLIRNQKNVLTDMRFVFSGDVILRDRSSEILFIGKPLPLDKKNTHTFIEKWKAYLTSRIPPLDDFLQDALLTFLETTLLSFSD